MNLTICKLEDEPEGEENKPEMLSMCRSRERSCQQNIACMYEHRWYRLCTRAEEFETAFMCI